MTIQQSDTGQTGQVEPPSQTPASVGRAEQLMTNWGHNVGYFTGMTLHRLQNAMASIREDADRMDQPQQRQQSSQSANSTSPSPSSSTTAQETSAQQGQPTTQIVNERAEQLVDGFAQRVAAITAATGLQLRRTSAFVREDAEDIWAEAQSIRNQQKHPL